MLWLLNTRTQTLGAFQTMSRRTPATAVVETATGPAEWPLVDCRTIEPDEADLVFAHETYPATFAGR